MIPIIIKIVSYKLRWSLNFETVSNVVDEDNHKSGGTEFTQIGHCKILKLSQQVGNISRRKANQEEIYKNVKRKAHEPAQGNEHKQYFQT